MAEEGVDAVDGVTDIQARPPGSGHGIVGIVDVDRIDRGGMQRGGAKGCGNEECGEGEQA
jgi:uncharacterized phage protein gp47/JayE